LYKLYTVIQLFWWLESGRCLSRCRPPAWRPSRAPREPRELDAKAAKLAAFELLAMKAWSARELIRRLRRRGASAEIARGVVDELQTRGFVDDAAFARFWAGRRARGRPGGRRHLGR